MKNPLPERFIERIQEMLPANEWNDFFESATQPLPKTIRVTRNFKKPQHWKLSPTAIKEAFFIERKDQSEVALGKTLEHFTGKMYVQSLSSMLPVIALNPQPGEKILDLCAAPGSKTTFLAQRMENTGLILANEPSSSRSAKLASNLDRMGVANTVMMQNDGSRLSTFFAQEFDKVLLDAPCSSEGFGRKDADFFKKMWAEKKIFEAAKLQRKLITSAFEMLCVGGEMIYSTCTTAPEENEAVVQFLIDTYGEAVEILPVELKDIPASSGLKKFGDQEFPENIWKNVRRIWPHQRSKNWDSECFFLAKIKKSTPLSLARGPKCIIKNPPLLLGKNQIAEVFTSLSKKFGIDRAHFPGISILKHQNGLSITTKEAGSFAVRNPHRRCGLPILDKYGNITSSFAIHFGHLATLNILELSLEQKDRWMAGYDVPLSQNFPSGPEILVQYQGFCLGYGKVQKQNLKNKLDRNLVFS